MTYLLDVVYAQRVYICRYSEYCVNSGLPIGIPIQADEDSEDTTSDIITSSDLPFIVKRKRSLSAPSSRYAASRNVMSLEAVRRANKNFPSHINLPSIRVCKYLCITLLLSLLKRC